MKKILFTFSLLCLIFACANPGSGPDGGPYDETPPRIVEMRPALGQINAKQKKVEIAFDEYIKVENAVEKVIVSPPQIEVPEIKVLGKRISINLSDTLKPATTYTIDFSDAITDVTEGNPLGNFTYYFSTGEQLDTMEVAGHVLNAADLEPVKGILVGLHSDSTDSVFNTKPFERVARTNGDGRFSIKGVAPGKYRIYALQDMEASRIYGEQSGIYKRIIRSRRFWISEYSIENEDLKTLEKSFINLYSQAQEKNLAPIFPPSLLLQYHNKQIRCFLLCEITDRKTNDERILEIPQGEFSCFQEDLLPTLAMNGIIERYFSDSDRKTLIITNLMLTKYQIDNRKNELQFTDKLFL